MADNDKVKIQIADHNLRIMDSIVVTKLHALDTVSLFTANIVTTITIHGYLNDIDANPVSIIYRSEDIGSITIVEINSM